MNDMRRLWPKPGLPESGSDASALDIQRYLDMFMRRPWLIAGVFAAVFLLGGAFVVLQPKKYMATASVQVDIHQHNAADLLPEQASGESPLADSSRMDTEVAILQSRALAEEVLAVLGASGPPEPAKARGPISQALAGVEGAMAQAAKTLAPRPTAKPSAAAHHDRLLEELQKPLKVSREGASYVIKLTYTARDPVWAAKAANAFVSSYQTHKATTKSQTVGQANTFLNGTLADLGRQVVAADAAVAQYRTAHNLVQAGASTMNEQTISAIGQQLITARAEQAEAQARYSTAVAQLQAGSTGDDVGEALASPVIQQLRTQRTQVSQSLTDLRARYGAKHPDVAKTAQLLADIDAQIQAEIKRIISNLSAQAEVARQRTASLQNSLNGATGTLAASETASVKLSELLRNQEAARATYEEYLNRYKRTSAQQDLPLSDSKVLTWAAPPALPSSPNIPKSMALVLALSLALALAVMVGADFLEKGFNDPEEAESYLGITGLGAIPTLSSTLRGKAAALDPTQYVVDKSLSVFAESFRALRTSLMTARIGSVVKVVLVTSSLPGEGKTTTSVCLGRVAAMGAAKTVIIDCDLRRRSLDRVLGRKADIGLLEVLDGQAPLDDALVYDEGSEAYFLPLGAKTEAHRDVFNSAAMDNLLKTLRERFDLIVLDASPVLALADARVLAQRADATLLIACWRKTPRRVIQAALRELHAVGANLAGIALTQVDARQDRRAGYGSGYYMAYEEYFSE
jgi:succinoglycan biosynthesis transport protein ExoP